VDVEPDAERITIKGSGGTLPPGPRALDARLSGTTSRFVLPELALGEGPYELDGAPLLRARPMGDGIDALRSLGAEVVELGERGHLPVRVARGGADAGPRDVHVAGDASSQFLSGLLLAAPCFAGGLRVVVDGPLVSAPYVELTRSVMGAFDADVAELAPQTFGVAATGYRGTTFRVEPDASAASYFFAAAAITAGRVTIEGLGATSGQGDLRFVDVLEAMGCEVVRGENSTTVVGPEQLHGVQADLRDFSDTAQTLAVTAAFADGPTMIDGIGFIRRKETDRLHATVTELRRCGVAADELPDGIRVHPGRPHGAEVQTYDDHRMAMSFALLGLRTPGIAIADPACVGKTFPGYFVALDQLR
jgi:3-phosphoshikimate 1-carboxyvinyltransferase